MPPAAPGLQEFPHPDSLFPRQTRSAPCIRLPANSRRAEKWFKKHPRYHLHFTPVSASWLNQVERWFARITEQRIRRSAFFCIKELEAAIIDYMEHNNRTPKPFVWTASADAIPGKLKTTCECINQSPH